MARDAGVKKRIEIPMSRNDSGRREERPLKILGKPRTRRYHRDRPSPNPEVRVFPGVHNSSEQFSGQCFVRLHPLIFGWIHWGEGGTLVN